MQVTLYGSLLAYPCSASSCAAGTCSHPYCATSGQACTTADETFNVNVGPIAFWFACCTGSDLASCGNPNPAAGFVTLTTVTGTASYVGKNGQCAPLQSAAGQLGQWDFSAVIPTSAIQAQCGTRTGWVPLIAPGVRAFAHRERRNPPARRFKNGSWPDMSTALF